MRDAVFFLMSPSLTALSIACCVEESVTAFLVVACTLRVSRTMRLRRKFTTYLRRLTRFAFFADEVFAMRNIIPYKPMLCNIRKPRYDICMIGYLEGTVLAIRDSNVVLGVGSDNSQVGYLVHAKKELLATAVLGSHRSMWTYTAVRETALDIYGFDGEDELAVFEMLLTVSGIGPKSALSILDVATTDILRNAIAQENAGYLTSISGIGKKTAEKIILELKGKVLPTSDLSSPDDAEALEALRTLGYSTQEGREALRMIPNTIHGTNDRLREALRQMQPQK
jgi:Holliday junction DNA helicase RuvA